MVKKSRNVDGKGGEVFGVFKELED